MVALQPNSFEVYSFGLNSPPSSTTAIRKSNSMKIENGSPALEIQHIKLEKKDLVLGKPARPPRLNNFNAGVQVR